jgi:hypothetical protein
MGACEWDGGACRNLIDKEDINDDDLDLQRNNSRITDIPSLFLYPSQSNIRSEHSGRLSGMTPHVKTMEQ